MSRRPRNEELDFDDGKGAAQTLKIVGLGLGSLVCVGLIFGGFLFLSSRKTEMANLPSVQGMIMQVGSKGRITAREFDETIGNVCHTMAVMSQGMGDDGESSAIYRREKAIADCKARR